jgi:hypothetical protein
MERGPRIGWGVAVGPVKTAVSAAELTLIPYGAAKLRVTALPQIL